MSNLQSSKLLVCKKVRNGSAANVKDMLGMVLENCFCSKKRKIKKMKTCSIFIFFSMKYRECFFYF